MQQTERALSIGSGSVQRVGEAAKGRRHEGNGQDVTDRGLALERAWLLFNDGHLGHNSACSTQRAGAGQ